MPFADWQALPPARAAREVAARLLALPAALRSAALAWARPEHEMEAELARATGPLRGLPYLAKDLFDVAGAPTRAGSAFLAEVRPTPGDSALVRRLRELGATLAGKTHLVEFAAGLTGENRTFGDCPHPQRADRLSGGSSSGSAALVAAGVTPFALGSDTGGSVRVPAAFCGLYGFRLAPGDAFVRDAFPLSPTCDTAGWFTVRARDLATLNRALVGPPAAAPRDPRGVFLRAREIFAAADPALDAACETAARRLAAPADATLRAALAAAWSPAVDAYTTVVTHEAFKVHERWLEPWRERYDPGIWQRFTQAGRTTPAQLAAAQGVFAAVRAQFAALFREFDFVVLPCAPVPALTKAQCTPETRRAILTFTAPASLAGLPVLTLPVPLADGLSGGLQVVAPRADSPVFEWVLGRHAED
ncbi:amidase [Oleiharenicola sp. Vm1]|uniref:amidase n=1 Tax=Oleiharenicola sp. Vm1 TaxID=3398393 RepID=UPI0039F56CF9